MSILGYALLPMLPLAAIDIFLELKSSVGVLLSLSFAVWSSIAAGNMINILQQQV